MGSFFVAVGLHSCMSPKFASKTLSDMHILVGRNGLLGFTVCCPAALVITGPIYFTIHVHAGYAQNMLHGSNLPLDKVSMSTGFCGLPRQLTAQRSLLSFERN